MRTFQAYLSVFLQPCIPIIVHLYKRTKLNGAEFLIPPQVDFLPTSKMCLVNISYFVKFTFQNLSSILRRERPLVVFIIRISYLLFLEPVLANKVNFISFLAFSLESNFWIIRNLAKLLFKSRIVESFGVLIGSYFKRFCQWKFSVSFSLAKRWSKSIVGLILDYTVHLLLFYLKAFLSRGFKRGRFIVIQKLTLLKLAQIIIAHNLSLF